MFFSKNFPLVGEAGQEIGAVVLEHLWADVYGIKIKKVESHPNVSQWTSALALALEEANSRSARQVMFRLITSDGLSELGAELPRLGFTKKHDRVEYRKSLDVLPDDSGSPIRWQTAEQLNWSEQEIADLLATVAQGDPDTDPNDDPLTFIQDFLADPVLTAGLSCIHVGFVESTVAALTVVQINSKSGWSRISYMGIAPKFRSRGLGKWIHRYSFTVMKAQGGKLYHGGTVATNEAMMKLFEAHGCDRFREMEEWIYFLNRGRQ